MEFDQKQLCGTHNFVLGSKSGNTACITGWRYVIFFMSGSTKVGYLWGQDVKIPKSAPFSERIFGYIKKT